jgi:hypothetical protein
MLSKFKFLLLAIVSLSICYPALAEGGENAGNQQSPVQVIVAIVFSAIVLRVLDIFKLP